MKNLDRKKYLSKRISTRNEEIMLTSPDKGMTNDFSLASDFQPKEGNLFEKSKNCRSVSTKITCDLKLRTLSNNMTSGFDDSQNKDFLTIPNYEFADKTVLSVKNDKKSK